MSTLTQQVEIQQLQEQLRDVQQSIQSLADVVKMHSKNADDDRVLVNQLGDLVNELIMARDQAKEAPPTPRTGNARQAKRR